MKLNNTIVKSYEILKLLSLSETPLTLADIVKALNFPKTTTFDIIKTLNELGLIEMVDQVSKSYSIGLASFIIGNSFVRKLDVIKIAEPIMMEVGKKLGRTVFLGMLSQNKVVYIHKFESNESIITTSKIGAQNELYCTALGKSLLAFNKNTDEILDHIDFVKKTEHTITDRLSLEKELELTAKRGFSIDNREFENHVFCVAAPIFDFNGEVSYAISTSDLFIPDVTLKSLDHLSSSIKEAASKISTRLGYMADF